MNKTISSLVQSQFPQFVREDYPTLVAFIQAYYQYLELQKNPQDVLTNLMSYRDIDRTLDEFVVKFEKEYIDGLPQNVVGDKRRFIKHVTDLYNTKGTEESYRLLFRLLFGEEIELYYPKQQMLVASGGTWSQRNSIQVILDPGVSPDCVNKTIKINTANGVINTYITDVVALNVEERLYELFIHKNFAILPNPGDRVVGKNLAGTCQATAIQADILSGGAGFHVGQVFEINSVLGSGAKVKVTSVDSNGAIKRLAFIQFGTNYEASFQVALDPNVRTSGAINPYASYTNGFIESVLVTKVTYFSSDYCDITYSGQIIGSSYTNDYRPDNALDPSVTPAVVQFELGALCPYRGEYTSAGGFLSDVNVIQDGYMYQDFSYVIKTKQKLDDFKNMVKNLVHPAGTAMFSEMDLTSDMDVSAAYDYAKVLSAALKFFETLTPTDAIRFLTGKSLTDSSKPIDTISKAIGKALNDAQSSIDSVKLKTGKNLTETQTSSDTVTLNTGKNLTDSSTLADSISKAIDKHRTDSITSTDAIALNTSRTITGDSVSPVDNTPSALLIDYCDYTYLAQNYVGTVLM
jgi:glutamine amidotransferase-like uncharacterized protein